VKVVLFCGGLGTRLREHSETVPKPLVGIAGRPILWHLMRYYAHFGHKDFILCLGYRGELIRDYFLHYNECLSNDFTLCDGGARIELHSHDAGDWSIRCIDTGLHANIGQRLLRVRECLRMEEMFLANYSDGLSDLPLNELIAAFARTQAVAAFAAVPPRLAGVYDDQEGYVSRIGAPREAALVNGGFFVLRPEIFGYLNDGEELVEQPFARLIEQGRLMSYQHRGFWHSMDTYRDRIALERMAGRGECPWAVWRT
jgi:glucose-1-phosphate cytidylyltransferase